MLDADRLDPTKVATLVVAETRSPCDVPFARLRGLAFLRQERDEEPTALAARLARVLGRVSTEALIVGDAWLLLSAAHDEALHVARRSIVSMLSRVVSRSGGRGLTIVASADASASRRASVFALAGEVLERKSSWPISVHIRFVPAERRAPDEPASLAPFYESASHLSAHDARFERG